MLNMHFPRWYNSQNQPLLSDWALALMNSVEGYEIWQVMDNIAKINLTPVYTVGINNNNSQLWEAPSYTWTSYPLPGKARSSTRLATFCPISMVYVDNLSSGVQTHPLHTSADKVLVALATTYTRPGSHYYVQLARTGQAHGVITGGDTYGTGHIVSIVTVLLMT